MIEVYRHRSAYTQKSDLVDREYDRSRISVAGHRSPRLEVNGPAALSQLSRHCITIFYSEGSPSGPHRHGLVQLHLHPDRDCGFFLRGNACIACACGLVQCLWKRHPAALQVWFAVATGAVSAGPAWYLPRLILHTVQIESTVLLLVLAAPLYFAINSSLVAGVVAFVEEKTVKSLWKHCSVWAYAWFALQTAIAGLIVALTRSEGWFIPLCGVIFFFVFKTQLKRLSRVFGVRDAVGRKATRYGGVNSPLEMVWRDSHGISHSLQARIVDVSEWGARVECTEPVTATSIRVSTVGYNGLAALCYCQFHDGKYIVGLEFTAV